MATGNGGGGGRGVGSEDQLNELAELSKTLKEGERILAPTRRPDGTLRKPIRIRAGYVPQDEVAIYQSKGALWKKEMEAAQEVPPGYDPDVVTKPKTKSVKRNERKKEKRLQGKNLDQGVDGESNSENQPSAKCEDQESESIDSVASQIIQLTISMNSSEATSQAESVESLNSGNSVLDIDKRIRALKKKIRLAEAQQQKTSSQDIKPEQLEKMKKLEGWHEELMRLCDLSILGHS